MWLKETMVVFRRAAAWSLFLVLGACGVGEVPIGGGGTPDGGGGTPAQTFESQIKPLVTNCLGCHSGIQGPILTSYDTLAAKYKVKPGETNILVTKADATGGTHQGIQYFTGVTKTAVANWINSLP
jgi:hypothetical protein